MYLTVWNSSLSSSSPKVQRLHFLKRMQPITARAFSRCEVLRATQGRFYNQASNSRLQARTTPCRRISTVKFRQEVSQTQPKAVEISRPIKMATPRTIASRNCGNGRSKHATVTFYELLTVQMLSGNVKTLGTADVSQPKFLRQYFLDIVRSTRNVLLLAILLLQVCARLVFCLPFPDLRQHHPRGGRFTDISTILYR